MDSKQLAWKIRRHAVEMTHSSQSSHIGSVLSVADIVAVLYNDIANLDPHNPNMPDRDRIILSKGHAGASVYAVLAEKSFFDIEELKTHYRNGSRLSGHVSHKGVPGIEFSTGSLGHGLSVAVGMAYAAKQDKKPYNIYVICGDGECEEGAMWEAALVAHHNHLNNLIVIIDYNKMQSLGFCDDIISLSPLAEKWKAFGWNTIEVDGHDYDLLGEAFHQAAASDQMPTAIIAHTIKGKGISFMENNILWHYRFPHDGEEYNNAVSELRAQLPEGITDPYDEAKEV
jgi:Transketolase, N-terminal subunit